MCKAHYTSDAVKNHCFAFILLVRKAHSLARSRTCCHEAIICRCRAVRRLQQPAPPPPQHLPPRLLHLLPAALDPGAFCKKELLHFLFRKAALCREIACIRATKHILPATYCGIDSWLYPQSGCFSLCCCIRRRLFCFCSRECRCICHW